MTANRQEELFNQPIELLDFEPRIFQALKKHKIHTYEDLLKQDLRKVKGIGLKSQKIIELKLNEIIRKPLEK